MNEGDRLKRILVLCLVVLMLVGCCGMSSKIDTLFRLNLTHPNVFGYGSVFYYFYYF